MVGIACVGLLLAVGLGPRTGHYRTLTVLSGSMDREVVFTERWRMVLDGSDHTPWKIAS